MSASVTLWKMIDRLHDRGFGKLASGLVDRFYRDRHFSVDGDGHWINRQQAATFASPDVHAVLHSYVAERTRDIWLHDYAPAADDVVVDVGAGIGEEALVLAPSVRRVVAIEAHPETFRCLQKTIRLSGLTNVTAVHCAISDVDGEVRISTGSNHLANRIGEGDSAVPAKTLRSLADELGIERIDYLKMNIEGAERQAMNGLGDLQVDRFAVSCHDFIPGAHYATRAEVTAALKARGYAVEERPTDPRPWVREMVYAKRKEA